MRVVTFDQAFDRVISHEGNFQNDPRDRGNWTTGVINKGFCNGTKYGISAMSYPHLDIRNLTVEDVKEIYKEDFWDTVHADKLSPALAYQLFDAAVNHGIGNTIKMLQRAVGAKDDGLFGPNSLKAVQKVSESDTLALFLAERLEFMTNVRNWSAYSKGWSRRIAQNLRYAAKDTVE